MDEVSNHDRKLAGKCLCGAVHYAVADEFVYAANCHCSNCRRTTGSAFKPFAGIERDKLALTEGASTSCSIFGDESGHDAHCELCGSLLYSLVREGAFVHVAMGTLVDDPTIRPTAHIFVGSKATWFTVADDLPQYDEHVPRSERLEPASGEFRCPIPMRRCRSLTKPGARTVGQQSLRAVVRHCAACSNFLRRPRNQPSIRAEGEKAFMAGRGISAT